MVPETKWKSIFSVVPDIVGYAFGRPDNWSLADMATRNRIALFAHQRRVTKIFAPVPSQFNAKICARGEFNEEILIPLVNRDHVTIFRSPPADGCEILAYEGFFIASGDCPTIVVHDPDSRRTFCAHAGRDCLFDRSNALGRGKSREHDSVVHALLAEFPKEVARNLKVFIACGISGRNFSHPLQGHDRSEECQKMLMYIEHHYGCGFARGDLSLGCISLKDLIRMQLVQRGVESDNIGCDNIDTFADTDRGGNHVWWSNRRGDKKERNGVLILRLK